MLVLCAAVIYQCGPHRSMTSVISVRRTWPGARSSPWAGHEFAGHFASCIPGHH